MPTEPNRQAELISRLANALQTALLLVTRLEPDTRQAARDAGALRDAVERAATAAQELRTGGER